MAAPFLWFKVFLGVSGHLKVRRLARRIGEPQRAALGLLLMLWEIGAKYAPGTGVLEGNIDQEELELELGWAGKPGALLTALIEARLIDRSPLRIHEWTYHQPELQKLAGVRDPPGRRAPTAPPAPSAHFARFWARLPTGCKHGTGDAYKVWRRQGLDDDTDTANAERARLYRVLDSQLNNDHWRKGLSEDPVGGLKYIRRRDWLLWGEKPEKPESERTTEVQIIDPPRRNDEKDLRADWAAANEGREWPGYEAALAEMMRRKN